MYDVLHELTPAHTIITIWDKDWLTFFLISLTACLWVLLLTPGYLILGVFLLPFFILMGIAYCVAAAIEWLVVGVFNVLLKSRAYERNGLDICWKIVYIKNHFRLLRCAIIYCDKKKTFMVCVNVNKIFKYRDAYARLINFVVKLW